MSVQTTRAKASLGFRGETGSVVWGVTEGGSGSGGASSGKDFCDSLRHLGIIT